GVPLWILSINLRKLMRIHRLINSSIYLCTQDSSIALFNKALVDCQSKMRNLNIELQGLTTDLISSCKDIKITNSVDYVNQILSNKIDIVLLESKRFCIKKGIYGFFQGLIICFVIIAVNSLAISRYNFGMATIGDLVLINNYLILVFRPLESFSLVLRGLAKSYFDFLSLEELVDFDKDTNEIYSHPISSIHLSNISVGNILKNVNLDINLGEKIVIVGESGSGKSTLLNLISGFLDDYLGDIYINNNKNNLIDPITLRKAIAYYSSDSKLISTDMASNISLGKDVDVTYYLNSVFLCDKADILMNKNGSGTSEPAVNLSTGEIQRVKIARTLALARDFEFYDEATSALDDRLTEKLLDRLISRKNKAIIFITHNEKFINKFDKMYSLNNGNLVLINKKEFEYA
ncbi:MAG: ABC transporter ATP-binding protein, partial [Gammaproteobacteria bacterium]